MRLYQSTYNGLYVVAPKGTCGKNICGPGVVATAVINLPV